MIQSSVEWWHGSVLVPRAPPLPAWTLLVRTFPAALWALLAAVAAAYALAWRVVAGEALGASVAAALRALSSCGGSPQDRVRATPQRLQLAAALLTSAIVLVALYQGRLFTLMTQPECFEEIDTFKQLVEYNMTIFGINEDHLFYFQSANLHADVLEDGLYRQKAVEMPRKLISKNEAGKLLKGNSQFAFIDDNYDNRLKYRQVLSSIWNNIHQMRAQILPTVKTYVVRKKWPFKEHLERIYGRLVDAGIVSYWKDVLRDTGMKMEMWGHSEEDAPPSDDPQRFGPEDFQAHFLLLGAGLLLAAAALAVEAALSWRRSSMQGRRFHVPEKRDVRAAGCTRRGTQRGRLPEGRLPEGRLPEGRLPKGRLPEGRLPEGLLPEGRLPEGRLPEGRLPEGRLPEGWLPEGRDAGLAITEVADAGGGNAQVVVNGRVDSGELDIGGTDAIEDDAGGMAVGGDEAIEVDASEALAGGVNRGMAGSEVVDAARADTGGGDPGWANITEMNAGRADVGHADVGGIEAGGSKCRTCVSPERYADDKRDPEVAPFFSTMIMEIQDEWDV